MRHELYIRILLDESEHARRAYQDWCARNGAREELLTDWLEFKRFTRQRKVAPDKVLKQVRQELDAASRSEPPPLEPMDIAKLLDPRTLEFLAQTLDMPGGDCETILDEVFDVNCVKKRFHAEATLPTVAKFLREMIASTQEPRLELRFRRWEVHMSSCLKPEVRILLRTRLGCPSNLELRWLLASRPTQPLVLGNATDAMGLLEQNLDTFTIARLKTRMALLLGQMVEKCIQETMRSGSPSDREMCAAVLWHAQGRFRESLERLRFPKKYATLRELEFQPIEVAERNEFRRKCSSDNWLQLIDTFPAGASERVAQSSKQLVIVCRQEPVLARAVHHLDETLRDTLEKAIPEALDTLHTTIHSANQSDEIDATHVNNIAESRGALSVEELLDIPLRFPSRVESLWKTALDEFDGVVAFLFGGVEPPGAGQSFHPNYLIQAPKPLSVSSAIQDGPSVAEWLEQMSPGKV